MDEAKRALAKKSEWAMNLRGDLQMHTRWSDRSGTIAEMAEAATERSYEYIGITDHSQGLKIASGIDERALKTQGKEIVKLNLLNRKSGDRKSTRLNSSHANISYAAFCLQKK